MNPTPESQIENLIPALQAILIALFILFVLAALVAIFGYLFIIWYRNRRREERSLDFVLLRVAVPKDNEIKIDAAEQMFASLYSIRKGGKLAFLRPQDHLSLEIVALPEDIRFYVSCPVWLRDLVEKQIHGAYSGAEVVEVDEYNIFSEEGKVAFTSIKLRKASYYPLKVYKDLPTDSLASLTSALAKMGEGEGAAVQILISPASNKWRAAGKKYISSEKTASQNKEKPKVIDQKELEAIENKVSKPGFETMVRLVVSSKTREAAKMHLDNIKGAFEQFSGAYNGFKSAKMRLPFQKRAFMVDFIYRYQPVLGRPSILNSEELATIFHFPNKSIETPHIFWLYSKRAPAPAQIPTSGLYLGKSSYRGIERPIYLMEDDRRRHMYIIGKTGTGKSELLKNLIMQDIYAGRGVCFIDPHGDVVEDILRRIPPQRAEEVVYFYPGDYARPMGLNLLESYTEEQKHFVVNSIIGLMYKLYDPARTGIIGPRFEHAIRNAMLTVMSEPGATFVEVVRCLTDSSYVQELLPKVRDPVIRRYWTDQIAQTADFHKSEVLDYIVSKFGRFVTNAMMRNIIGQSKSAFDLRQVMDEKKILMINLAKGEIGEENASFLGLVLVPKILIAAMSRVAMPEEQRVDFYLYVDEFQNFATPEFAQILAEARKFRLNLTVANQFIGQMEEEVKNAVFGNVGTLVTFRVGVTDAGYLQHEFQPTFNEPDLINIERFQTYVKTIVRNEPVPSFSMKTELTQAPVNEKVAEAIKQLSKLRYGRDRAVVEQEIVTRARL